MSDRSPRSGRSSHPVLAVVFLAVASLPGCELGDGVLRSSGAPDGGEPQLGAGGAGGPGSRPGSGDGRPSDSPCPGGDCGEGVDRLAFTCDSGAEPSVTPLRRLSRADYTRTVADLLAARYAPAERDEIMAALETTLGGVPPDVGHVFESQDATTTQQHLDAYYLVARRLSDEVTASPGRLEALAGACAVAAPDAACVRDFITDFGLLALRRPLTGAEVDRYLEYYAEEEAVGFSTVVFAFLMAKEFIYRLELDGDPVEGREGLFELTGYEVATRLSYYFWGTLPDQALLEAAALPSTDEGALTHPEGYRRQVERLANPATDEARATTARFFRQWLALDDVPTPHEALSDDPWALREAMVAEVEALTDYYTWTVEGRYEDLIESDVSFARGPLAEVYGVEPWSGDPEGLVHFPAGERAGLLTRAALLSTGGQRQNAMLRGIRVFRDVLCGQMQLPSPDDVEGAGQPPEWTASKGTRQLYEETTEQGYCAGCHAVINPLGFAFEHYDAVGRHQTEEHLSDDSGSFVHLVDAASDQHLYPGDTTPTVDGVDFSQHVADTGVGAACMVRSYFRFAYGRAEDFEADGCVLEDLRQRLDGDGGSFAAMFRGAPLRPDFILRRQ